ncbi:MAG: hypothetical protein WCL16_05680 [bacterium]
MEEKKRSVDLISPLKLLTGFSKGRIVYWIAVAVVVHVTLIGLLSMGYIRDRWIAPEAAAERKQAALAAQEVLKKQTAAKLVKPSVATGQVTQAGAATTAVAAVTGASTGTTAQILNERKDTAIVKRITEKAQPGEIPAQPSDLGISIGDTEVH